MHSKVKKVIVLLASVIVRIPKKGNLTECSNWRGITLLSVPGKVMSNIIYARFKNEAHDAMREEQAGFRKYRGCSLLRPHICSATHH